MLRRTPLFDLVLWHTLQTLLISLFFLLANEATSGVHVVCSTNPPSLPPPPVPHTPPAHHAPPPSPPHATLLTMPRPPQHPLLGVSQCDLEAPLPQLRVQLWLREHGVAQVLQPVFGLVITGRRERLPDQERVRGTIDGLDQLGGHIEYSWWLTESTQDPDHHLEGFCSCPT